MRVWEPHIYLNIRRVFSLLTLATMLSTALYASGSNSGATAPYDPYKGYSEEVYMDMEFEANLSTPEVPAKQSEDVKKKVMEIARSYRGSGDVDLVRNGEVMLITIGTDVLFEPNDTILTKEADSILKSLLPPAQDPMMFKLVLAVHTDDTGSELYRDNLSISRLNSIYDWFISKIDEGKIGENLVIIPFSMSSTMPLTDNDSRKHRSENRRLEVYYVPGPKLIDMAMKGLIK